MSKIRYKKIDPNFDVGSEQQKFLSENCALILKEEAEQNVRK